MSRRNETRIKAEIPLRLLGTDAESRPYNLETKTIDISLTGARVRGIRCHLRQGDIVAVSAPHGRARFRITGLGKPGSAHEGEISLSCVEPGKCIWDPKLFSASTVRPSANRRKAERFLCTGTAEVVAQQGGMPLWCKLADISHTGCYLETPAPLPIDAQVRLALTVDDIVIHAEAEVRTTHQTVGMGLAFRHMSNTDADRFSKLMRKLNGIYDECASATTGRTPQWDTHVKACDENLQLLLGLVEEGMVEPDLAVISDLERLLKGVSALWEAAQLKVTVEK